MTVRIHELASSSAAAIKDDDRVVIYPKDGFGEASDADDNSPKSSEVSELKKKIATPASDSAAGVVRLATNAERGGQSNSVVMTPAGVQSQVEPLRLKNNSQDTAIATAQNTAGDARTRANNANARATTAINTANAAKTAAMARRASMFHKTQRSPRRAIVLMRRTHLQRRRATPRIPRRRLLMPRRLRTRRKTLLLLRLRPPLTQLRLRIRRRTPRSLRLRLLLMPRKRRPIEWQRQTPMSLALPTALMRQTARSQLRIYAR